MPKLIRIFLLFFSFTALTSAQSDEHSPYPSVQGRILYEYEGNTEGIRELFFRDYGREIALYTNLSRSSTFFAITTTTNENVLEYLKEGVHYHFDLELKRGLVIKSPVGLVEKYFQIPGKRPYKQEMENIGAKMIKQDTINGLLCEHWEYRSRNVWIHKGLLIKMESSGLNKNFRMEAIEVDFEKELPEDKFNFPEDIPLPEIKK